MIYIYIYMCLSPRDDNLWRHPGTCSWTLRDRPGGQNERSPFFFQRFGLAIHIYKNIHACMRMYVYIYTNTHIYVYYTIQIHKHIYIIHIYIYIYMYILHIHKHIYVYSTHTHIYVYYTHEQFLSSARFVEILWVQKCAI